MMMKALNQHKLTRIQHQYHSNDGDNDDFNDDDDDDDCKHN